MSQESDLSLNELIISLVKAYPCLWDMRDRSYSDAGMKANTSSDIGRTIDKPVDFCKSRWKSLRDRYNRSLKENTTKSGQAANSRVEWALKSHLEFLRPILTPRKPTESSNLIGGGGPLIVEVPAQEAPTVTVPQLQMALAAASEQSGQDELDITFEEETSQVAVSVSESIPTRRVPLFSPPVITSSSTFRDHPRPMSSCSSTESRSSSPVITYKKRRKEEEVDTAIPNYFKNKTASQTPATPANKENSKMSPMEQFFMSVAKEAENLTTVRRMKLRRFVDEKLLELFEEQEAGTQ